MAQERIATDFVWYRDPERRFVLSGEGQVREIIWPGWRSAKDFHAATEGYHPLQTYLQTGLLRRFVRGVNDAASALEFVNEVGPLGIDEIQQGKPRRVSDILKLASDLRGPFEDKLKKRDNLILPKIKAGLDLVGLYGDVELDPLSGRPSLVILPQDLGHALRFLLFKVICGIYELRQCPQCRELFEVGPGTGRTLRAEFCTDGCQITFNSHKRTKGKKR